MRVKKQFLTLIEIMLVVTILIVTAGAIGFNIRKAMVTQKFNTETNLLVDSIRLAQDLMLVLGKDVHLIAGAAPDGSGIEYHIEIEGGTPKNWQPVIESSNRKMESTHFINFRQKDMFLLRSGEIDLRFQSKGSMMSKGELQLSTHENPYTSTALRRSICLRGYPHAVSSVPVVMVPSPEDDWITCDDDQEQEEFFRQLTLYMKEEILEDKPPNKSKAPVEDEDT